MNGMQIIKAKSSRRNIVEDRVVENDVKCCTHAVSRPIAFYGDLKLCSTPPLWIWPFLMDVDIWNVSKQMNMQWSILTKCNAQQHDNEMFDGPYW